MSAASLKEDLELSKLLIEVIPQIMRSVRSLVRQIEGSTLTVPQFRVLAYVALQPCTNKQLAEWQGVSLPAMSRMVDSLVRRKLLIRTQDRIDRRQVQLQLSRKGKNEFERLRKALQIKLAEHIKILGESDKKVFASGLSVLKELFSEV